MVEELLVEGGAREEIVNNSSLHFRLVHSRPFLRSAPTEYSSYERDHRTYATYYREYYVNNGTCQTMQRYQSSSTDP